MKSTRSEGKSTASTYVLNPQEFYPGTKDKHKPGELIEPGYDFKPG